VHPAVEIGVVLHLLIVAGLAACLALLIAVQALLRLGDEHRRARRDATQRPDAPRSSDAAEVYRSRSRSRP
jgi:hypothetical protein